MLVKMNEPTELFFCKNTGSFHILGQIILCFGKPVLCIVGCLVVACLPRRLSPINASNTKYIYIFGNIYILPPDITTKSISQC